MRRKVYLAGVDNAQKSRFLHHLKSQRLRKSSYVNAAVYQFHWSIKLTSGCSILGF